MPDINLSKICYLNTWLKPQGGPEKYRFTVKSLGNVKCVVFCKILCVWSETFGVACAECRPLLVTDWSGTAAERGADGLQTPAEIVLAQRGSDALPGRGAVSRWCPDLGGFAVTTCGNRSPIPSLAVVSPLLGFTEMHLGYGAVLPLLHFQLEV